MRSQLTFDTWTGERRNEANEAIATKQTGGNIKGLGVAKMGEGTP